jgi:hypothetical protein
MQVSNYKSSPFFRPSSNRIRSNQEHKILLVAMRMASSSIAGQWPLAEAPHDADDEAGDAVLAPAVAAIERVVPYEPLQAPVPRQRAGAVQDRRRRGRGPAGRHARREPRHRPQEQREQGLCTMSM